MGGRRWEAAHKSLLASLDCDVLLLTEVHVDGSLDGYERHMTSAEMGTNKHWAGVFARMPLAPMPDPHPATAKTQVAGLTVLSSVLPWPLAGGDWPWGPKGHDDRMRATVDELKPHLVQAPVVWGGDWNQPLTGNLSGFTRASQTILLDAVNECRLKVPTSTLDGLPKQATIDQIAVPEIWSVIDAGRVEAPGLSDPEHEAVYWIETEQTVTGRP
jgi:hypothetical protein